MTDDLETFVGDPPRTRWHRAWVVAAVTLGALVAAAAFRSSTGVLLEPIEEEFGWSRATTSGAVSLNLVLYGLTAPFAAAVMERWGVRRTVTAALVVVGVASGLTTRHDRAVAAVGALGRAHRRRHRGDGARARGDRREPLVPHPPRSGHGDLLRRQRHRPAALPAAHRPDRGGCRVARRRGDRGGALARHGGARARVPPRPAERRGRAAVRPAGGDGRATARPGPRPHRPSWRSGCCGRPAAAGCSGRSC